MITVYQQSQAIFRTRYCLHTKYIPISKVRYVFSPPKHLRINFVVFCDVLGKKKLLKEILSFVTKKENLNHVENHD